MAAYLLSQKKIVWHELWEISKYFEILFELLHSYVFQEKDLKSLGEGISGWREFNIACVGISLNRFIDLIQDD